MKKILLLLLLSFTVNAYSQESISDMFKSKERRATEAAAQKKWEMPDQKIKVLPKSNIDWAGFYLKKSAKMQYAAIGCATVSAILFASPYFIKDEFDVNKKTGEVNNKSNGTKDALVIVGGASLIAAVICEFCSINYKLKSGECLRLQATKEGAGLAFVF